MSDAPRDLISTIVERQQQAADLKLLSGELFKLFGGLAGFAKAYHQCYRDAPEGSSQQAQMLRSMLELMKQTAPEGAADPFAGFSKQELAAAAAHAIREAQRA